MSDKLIMSSLSKTWMFDLDGTILKHNGYKEESGDVLLEGVKEFWDRIPTEDIIIILTSRKEEYKKITEGFLIDNGIRFNHIIYDLPYGERIVVNDKKPSGLKMAYAINNERDSWISPDIYIDEKL